MPTPEPKTMARSLRTALAERDMPISHSTALELVARQFGYHDWNVLAARTPRARRHRPRRFTQAVHPDAGSGRIWLHACGAGRETLHSDTPGLAPGPHGPVIGTTDWTRRTVTIFVLDEAAYLGFGILFGSGTS